MWAGRRLGPERALGMQVVQKSLSPLLPQESLICGTHCDSSGTRRKILAATMPSNMVAQQRLVVSYLLPGFLLTFSTVRVLKELRQIHCCRLLFWQLFLKDGSKNVQSLGLALFSHERWSWKLPDEATVPSPQTAWRKKAAEVAHKIRR